VACDKQSHTQIRIFFFFSPNISLLLDEPTNHLDMEAVMWLEDYLSSWERILFFVCHSQDFMNNVCTNIVRLDMTYKKLRYYSGNYDTYVQTRRDQDMVQWRQYEAEQRDIAEIKDFIARFGHGMLLCCTILVLFCSLDAVPVCEASDAWFFYFFVLNFNSCVQQKVPSRWFVKPKLAKSCCKRNWKLD